MQRVSKIAKISLTILLVTIVKLVVSQSYFLNGSAVNLGNDCYRLTTTQGNQNGTVWYADQIDITQPFDITFEMYFGNLDDNGADGIVFILQTEGTDAIGSTGEGMGYSGFEPSIGIEFDTWQNGNLFDPSYDHISVQSNGNVNHNNVLEIADPVQASALSINIEDGQYHVVQIFWEPAEPILKVFFDCEPRISTTVDMASIFGQTELVYWGFSGATGGSWNNQIVCLSENILDIAPDVFICNGGSAELFVGGDPDGTFSWSPEEFLDDPNVQSPLATPDTTTTFTVSYTNLCGNVSMETVTVIVEDLVVSTVETGEINCGNSTLILDVNTNFPNEIDYIWTTEDGSILSGDSTQNPVIDGPGTYYVSASLNGECTAESEVTVVADYSDFFANSDTNGSINCLQETSWININPSITNGVTYDWSTLDGNITDGQGTSTIDLDQAGTYTVEVYLNENCFSSIEVVIISDFEEYPVVINSSDNIDCLNATVQISAGITGGNPDIDWETDGGNILSGNGSTNIIVDQAGTYTIYIINPNNGCESSAEVEIEEYLTIPEISIAESDTLTCRNPEVSLYASGPGPEGYNYTWTTSEGIVVGGSNSTELLVDEPGSYFLTVVDLQSGCIGTTNQEVQVNEDFYIDISSLTMPNVFTPDGDQNNQYFKPFLTSDHDFEVSEIMQNYHLKVFNRWGAMVYESTGADKLWDGTTNGNPLASGSYYYVLTYNISCSVNEDGALNGQVQLIKSE